MAPEPTVPTALDALGWDAGWAEAFAPFAADGLRPARVVAVHRETSIVRDAWARGQELHVHGFVYGLTDGLLHDLHCSASDAEGAARSYKSAVAALNAG